MNRPTEEHEEVKGLVPMRPGHRVTGACSCGWHSHSKTFAEHLEEKRPAGSPDSDGSPGA